MTKRVFDLGLNVDLTKYRVYDPAIGRWWQVDPLADEEDLVEFTPYNYSYNNPIRYNDPEGDCVNCLTALIGAGVGAVIGGAIEAGTQLYEHGEVNNWGAVGGAALQGGVTGGVAGFTGGASLLVATTASAAANVAGGAINNAVQGREITVGSVVKDAAVGVAAGVGGKILDKAVGAIQIAKTGNVLTTLAKEAKTTVTSKTGMVAGQKGFGTAAHTEFKALVDAKGLKNVVTEQSYKVGFSVKYGTGGSSRADVVLKHANGTVKHVFDFKTGGATLSTKQTNNYLKNVPGIVNPNQISTIR